MDKNNSRSIIEESRNENIIIYVGTVVICFLFAFLRAVIWFQILISASRQLHDKMFKAILRAPIYFFDTNPVGKYAVIDIRDLKVYWQQKLFSFERTFKIISGSLLQIFHTLLDS